MRIAVAGATGRIGRMTVEALTRDGHEAVAISRATGVDLTTGDGLEASLRDVEVVVDASNTTARDEQSIVEFFSAATGNLLAAEHAAGVGHHVLLSIVGIDHRQKVPHYAGKRAQERLVADGPVPWSIVRATQFHDFAAMSAEWAERDGVATVAPLLVQPVAFEDVAAALADVATGAPLRARIDVAGPDTHDLVDMARRTFAARGRDIRLVPTWQGIFDTTMAGEVLLPGPDARLGRITFDDWLAAGAPSS
ncbi:MAG: SDR family oxidoreductase [Jatrophihabitans sp.]|uniref:SDR family oxidoreductase n=1 Tax=Jatrophihabitans sp. TaxID=1932789 RepID=UPI0039150946